MATIYHEYGPGDETFICPQRKPIRQDSVELRETVRRLSESGVKREMEQRRKSEAVSDKASVLGSVQSMRQGKLPTNEQLNRVMNRLLSSKSIESNKQNMSADGQLLLKDFQELLLTFQRALQTKNRDELFQSMIYHVKKSEASLNDLKPGLEGDIQQKEQAKKDAKAGAGSILEIAKLFLFNASFRGVLEQILNIAQQTMGGVLQEGGKAIGDHANSETNSDGGSLGDKIRNMASKTTNSNNDPAPSSLNDQSSMKDKIRNAAAGAAGGAALGGTASHLASKNQDEESQSRDIGPQSGDMSSDLPKSHENFFEHRFLDPEVSAPMTDDGGNTINQGLDKNEQVPLNKSSATGIPQHQMFMTNSQSAAKPASAIPASAIPASATNNLQRSESPSSFNDMGQVGSPEPKVFKLEQFYGNHMGVYDSDMNKSKQTSAGKMAAGAAGATAGSLGMAGYLHHQKQDVRSESPSSFTDFGTVGNLDHGVFKQEQFYGNHMNVYDSDLNKPKQISAGKMAAAGAVAGATAGSLGMAGYLQHRTQEIRSESPSSFTDFGVVGNHDHGEFKPEQFYGNHMGVYESDLNKPSAEASELANNGLDMRQKLDAAVPKYAPGAMPASDEYIQSRFDAPSGGGNPSLHKRLAAAVPHSANAVGNVDIDGYGFSQKQQEQHQSINMLPDLNRNLQEDQDQDQDFLHKRLDKQVSPLASIPALSPQSHISAGAGYHLNQDNHTVPAKEIVETLRRPSTTNNETYAEDQVKAHANSFSGEHVMDKLKFTTGSGGALEQVNLIQDHANDFSESHALDRINSDTTTTDSHSRSAAMGATGLLAAGAGAGAAAMLSNKKSEPVAQDLNLVEKFKAGATDDAQDPSLDDQTEADVAAGYKRRTSFHEPHMYHGVDGQRHMDDGSSTQPIISNREAVRRMSSGEDLDLESHPTKPGSGIGPGAGAALGAGAGAASVAMATDSDDHFDKDTRISANKIVNNLKQKMGTESSNTENAEDEQDSISASEIIAKLKEILTTVQNNPEYQQAMSTLMSLVGTWGNRLKTGYMDRRRSSAVPVSEQNEYYRNTAAHEAKTIIEDWAQGKSLDPILQQFSEISSKLMQDDNLKNLMHKIIAYVQKMLQEPGYLSGDESTEEGSRLVDEVRQSALEEYKPQVKSMIQQSSGIIQSVSDDPISQKIAEKVKAIHDHLWYDSNGHAAFKPQLLNDMRITLLPALIEQIKYVPLPQIIYSDNKFEIAIENMVLQGDTLMPDIFEIKADDYLRFSPKANISFANSQSIHVHMTGIQTTMEDVVFYYRRKTGFPKLSDSGVVSVSTGGAGLRVSLRIVSSSVDQRHTFRIDQCHCHIDKLNVKVNHSKHNMLYKVLNPMMTGIIRRQMCKAIENKLIATFEQGDAKITKHLIAKKLSSDAPIKDSRRPGLFSHLVSVLNEKVSSI